MDDFVWLRRIRWTLAMFACAALLFLAYGVFEMVRNSGDLQAISGARLRMRLDELWPPNVDSSEVTNAYIASETSIDSGSTFLCFDADAETVQKWVGFLRQVNIDTAEWLDDSSTRQCETLESELGSIPFDRATGAVPEWWLPKGKTVWAFETMVWYKDSDSCVGRGQYLQFDEQSHRCWIFMFSCQHELLWPRGEGKLLSSK